MHISTLSIIGFIMQECKTAVYHLVGSPKNPTHSDSMLIWNCWFGNLCWLLSDQCHHLSSEWFDLPAPWKSNQSVMTKYGEIWKESLPCAFWNISYPWQICINRDQSSWKASFCIDNIKNCVAVEKHQRSRQLDSPVWHKDSIIHQLSGRSVIFWRFQRDTHQK